MRSSIFNLKDLQAEDKFLESHGMPLFAGFGKIPSLPVLGKDFGISAAQH